MDFDECGQGDDAEDPQVGEVLHAVLAVAGEAVTSVTITAITGLVPQQRLDDVLHPHDVQRGDQARGHHHEHLETIFLIACLIAKIFMLTLSCRWVDISTGTPPPQDCLYLGPSPSFLDNSFFC